MRDPDFKMLGCLVLLLSVVALQQRASGQSSTATSSSSSAEDRTKRLEEMVQAISTDLAATRQRLNQSEQEIQRLQEALAQIKNQTGAAGAAGASDTNLASEVKAYQKTTADMQEHQDTLEAQVKLHEQTKVESGSKYPVRLTGLILFNGFVNSGTVDNIDLPSLALRQAPGAGDGSAGATLRQTILGIEASGPRIAGARTSAGVTMDFFGGIAYSNFGTAAGIVRLRTAQINVDWTNSSVQAGMVGPLISPLSPTSYATIAEPGLAWAGNLWTWAPQLKVSHRFAIQDDHQIQLEFGLWDPPAAGYNVSDIFRVPSAGEQAKQPGYETRFSFGGASGEHSLQLGLGGYYGRQNYLYGTTNDSWAVTGDWQVPLSHGFELTGEAYRGRSLGGLGGGAYKDVLYGVNPQTGLPDLRGLNATGGWAQIKSRLGHSIEINAAGGQDTGHASDFHALILPSTATSLQLRARNRMIVGNVIFRPKTYLILSPEYRRIWTWPVYGAGSTADIFTLSAGYQF